VKVARKRPGDLAVVVLERRDPSGERVKIGEVVRRQDREVDLDLVQPRGVDRQMDQARVLTGVLEPGDRALTRVA
jgi:hypothetical protein